MDWNYWLGRKYANMDQQAAADTTRANAAAVSANAGAQLDTVKAGLLPAESKANIALTGAQTGLAAATARQQDEETKYIGPTANANIAESRARGGLYGAQATGEQQLSIVEHARRGSRIGGLGNSKLEDRLRSILRGIGIGLPASGQ
jgi:hypothetical protein